MVESQGRRGGQFGGSSESRQNRGGARRGTTTWRDSVNLAQYPGGRFRRVSVGAAVEDGPPRTHEPAQARGWCGHGRNGGKGRASRGVRARRCARVRARRYWPTNIRVDTPSIRVESRHLCPARARCCSRISAMSCPTPTHGLHDLDCLDCELMRRHICKPKRFFRAVSDSCRNYDFEAEIQTVPKHVGYVRQSFGDWMRIG